jgi:hypothetical protein
MFEGESIVQVESLQWRKRKAARDLEIAAVLQRASQALDADSAALKQLADTVGIPPMAVVRGSAPPRSGPGILSPLHSLEEQQERSSTDSRALQARHPHLHPVLLSRILVRVERDMGRAERIAHLIGL